MKKWLKEDFFRELIKGSLTLLTGSFGGALIGLATLSLTLKFIGTEWYGIYAIALTYSEIFDQLFNFQSWQALVKLGAVELEKEDSSGFRQYIKISFLFDISTSVLGALCAFFLAGIVGKYLEWNTAQIILAQVYSVWILFHVMGMPIGCLRLLGDFKYIARQRIIGSFVRFLVVAAVFLLKVKPLQFLIALVCTEIFDNSFLFFLAQHRIRVHGFKGWLGLKVDRNKVIEFVKFGIWTNLETTLTLPVRKFDKIIISRMFSYEAVSVFKFLDKFGQIIRKILSSLMYVIFPEFSKLSARNEMKSAYANSIKLGLLILAVGIPLWGIFSLSAPLWVGPLFSEKFVPYIPYLALYVGYRVVLASFISVEPAIISMGLVNYRFFINIASVAVYYGFLFLAGFKLGILGFIFADMVYQAFRISLRILVIMWKRDSHAPTG